jgi:hypothetical protein
MNSYNNDDEQADMSVEQTLAAARRSLAAGEQRELYRDAFEDASERWQRLREQSESKPQASRRTTPAPSRAKDERRELLAWIAMTVRDEVAKALRRALAAQKVALAEGIGKILAEERAKHRELATRATTVEQRGVDATRIPVLDLTAERIRRSGR